MNRNQKQLNWWDRVMMAVTFAEADETETARNILDSTQKGQDSRI
jgi:hypothetical protein